MDYRVYFDIPKSNQKHIKGSSLFLLDKLIEELNGAKEILISAFLFNNPVLQKVLEEKRDCKTSIYSLPLHGYDKKESSFIYYNHFNSHITSSKYKYAEKVYHRILQAENMELKIFPHTYIWHIQKTARGNNLYSLHNKSILAVFPNKKIKCISTSCNFAFGDPRHSENMLVIEDCSYTINMFTTYFRLLDKHSLSWFMYTGKLKQNNFFDIGYVVKPTNLNDTFKDCYFTAPFIKYNGIGSNHYVQKKIINFISEAKEKIYICSQHFSDIDSFDKKALSIVSKLEEMAKMNPRLEIRILKQTRASHQKQPSRTKKAESALKKFRNIKLKYWSPIIHDKFIIVDDSVMMGTANFTSTNYAWAEDHLMKYQLIDGNNRILEEKNIKNTFSEINSFHFIKNIIVTNQYKEHFKRLWDSATFI